MSYGDRQPMAQACPDCERLRARVAELETVARRAEVLLRRIPPALLMSGREWAEIYEHANIIAAALRGAP
jgi:hypothetical protein